MNARAWYEFLVLCKNVLPPVALSFVLTLAACGASTPPPPPAAPASESQKTGHDHGKLSPELKTFHDTLAPVWHSPAGAERVAKTCAAAADLSQKANATGDAELITSTTAAKNACAETNRPLDAVESALAKVHTRFHQLSER